MSGPAPSDESDPLDRGLQGLLDDERRNQAAASRRRRHWLQAQAAEGGTLAGALLDLGERRVAVTVSTRAGRRLSGAIAVLGADFVGLRTSDGGHASVRLAAITVVRPTPGEPRTVGARLVEVDATIAEVVTELAADRPGVSVHTDDGDTTAGRLLAVGRDLVTVAVGGDRALVYVSLPSVAAVAVP